MKNITLSADEYLIEQARLVARTRHTTLNAALREWLQQYTAVRQSAPGGFPDEALHHVRAGRHFRASRKRTGMNEG